MHNLDLVFDYNCSNNFELNVYILVLVSDVKHLRFFIGIYGNWVQKGEIITTARGESEKVGSFLFWPHRLMASCLGGSICEKSVSCSCE